MIDEYIKKLGIKRLNKIPLVIFIVILTIAVTAIAYVGKVKKHDNKETESYAAHDASSSAEDIIKSGETEDIKPNINSPPNIIKPKTSPPSFLQKPQPQIQIEDPLAIEAANADTKVDFKDKTPKKMDIPRSSPSVKSSVATMPFSEKKNEDNDQDQNLQARKESFLKPSNPELDYLAHSRSYPITPYEIRKGTVIPGVMISGINSDLPGQIIGQISQNVYDSASGKNLLLPQGSKLVGNYDSHIAYGQSRALVVWSRINFPDGTYLNIEKMPGADSSGYAGYKDKVNYHLIRLFSSAIMMSFISAGFESSQPDDTDNFEKELAASIGKNMSDVAMALILKNMNVQPTIMIRPGYKFNVMITKDIAFEKPYIPMHQ